MIPDPKPVIVCDNGTGFVKCGFSQSQFPEAKFPSILGRPVLRAASSLGRSNPTRSSFSGGVEVNLKEVMFGEEALQHRSNLQLSHPLENGIVQNWDDMELLWDYTFQDCLGIKDLTQHKILLTEPPLNPKRNRERMVATMFDKFGFQAVYVGVQAVLTLYSQGLQSGVVVDAGDGVTHIVPVMEGYVLSHLVKRLDVAGRDITRHLIKLLFNRGYWFNQTTDFESIRELKEHVALVSANLDQDRRLAQETNWFLSSYKMEDGRKIKLGAERFECAEVLFQPHLLDKECAGLSEQIFAAIQGADVDLRPDLYRHIVLSGGTTMLPGFPTRIENDLQQLYANRVLGNAQGRVATTTGSKVKIRVEAPPERKHMVFTGGAVLADLMKNNEAFWITKKEWQEQGPRILESKSI